MEDNDNIYILVHHRGIVITGQRTEVEINIWIPNREFINGATRFLRPDSVTTAAIPGTGNFIIVVGV